MIDGSSSLHPAQDHRVSPHDMS
jgi:hypothetical protein